MKEGWEIRKLNEACIFKSGTTIPEKLEKSEGEIPYLKVADMNFPMNENYITTSSRFVNKKDINEKSILPISTVIFPKRGGAIATNKKRLTSVPICADLNIMGVIATSILNSDYLFYYFKNINLIDISNGTTIPQINNYSFDGLEISFPSSKAEQQRIVAILDEAFAVIAKAKQNAERNLQNAKELFESYLNGVFVNKGDDWEERRLGDETLVQIIDGDRGKNYPSQKDFSDKGFCLFMNTKNVRPAGFEFDSLMFISEAKDKAMGKGKLRRNDVVMTTRGTIGNLGIYNDKVKYENIRINSGMLIFRPNRKQITSEYLFEILRSGIIKDQIRRFVTGAAQPQLPIKTLVNFIIPVPKEVKEQEEIVGKLNVLFIETQKLETLYQKKIADLEELKKSILQKAFSGELKTAALETV